MSTKPAPKLGDIFDRFWEDDEYRQTFLQNPAAILLEHRLMDVEGMEAEIVENKQNKIHLIFHSDSPDKIHLVSHRHPRMTDPLETA
ncbi:MAG: hypothetical protein P8K80_01120 [Phycisphaerales bacterium]|jgi:hypothetical protein|nr:hypothetical protein [Phycisphaerales bacterium]